MLRAEPALSRPSLGLAVLGVAVMVGGAFLKNESIGLGGIGIERLRRLEERFSNSDVGFTMVLIVTLRVSGCLRTTDSTQFNQ